MSAPHRHPPSRPPSQPQRRAACRQLCGLGLAGAAAVALQPARATPALLDEALRAFSGGKPVLSGRVQFEIASLVENGNVVPVSVQVQSPMTAADHVRRIALFTERNPEPGVAVFHLSPRSGAARVHTRIRLATSQRVLALAELSDGSYWQSAHEVVVTLAACVEG